ncbi:Proton/glutamate symport protein Sodium/glutamate symport protein [Moraxella catarrhalis]|uniref:Proton/glutamate symport protein Sodium/glutamate symport protein n=2 Tax=Moraxella catarrhalis TaxID=480 RepID=A0A198UIV7_MORCA|nr:dicarboxylate/amino acid:cation symporter [Moraxella catarrhalis]OAU95172.1 Proton/glutamate symport protein Sodium/glutamate symport protein [Moraxella catarrhalis]OAU97132.1 Proton/glutamate symport protein Sodium/glutamate symport protein [Moraxella catarrhalis]OAU99230.1 Proton/glutamate symport protein Sodium/glutamate symport protein [Moraxella catarrhalis]OAV00043.1 Proton/glutamate symport protein Sodium/glutamate symport protein [Moraxella catarrhalis]
MLICPLTKMTAGFALGILAGVILGADSIIFKPLGTLFLNLLRMIVVPLVVLSLIVAVNHSNPKELGRIGLKIFPFYLISVAIAVVVGIFFGKLTNPGVGLNLPMDATIETPNKPAFIDVILNMVPNNIINAMSSGDILAVVFVSIVFGLTILLMQHAESEREQNMGKLLLNIADAGNEAVAKVLNGILQYAPIGVFGITANTFGTQGMDMVIALGKFIGTSYLGVIVMLTVIYPLILKLFKVKVIEFYKNIKDAIFTAFATSSSLSTLPISMRAAEKAGISERVAKLTLPIGTTINMDGTAVRFGVAVIFASEIMGIHLGITELATIVLIGTLAAVGTAGVPGAGLIGMSIVFAQAGLPLEIVALTAGINVLVDMIFTCGNVTGDLVGAKVVDQSEKLRDSEII